MEKPTGDGASLDRRQFLGRVAAAGLVLAIPGCGSNGPSSTTSTTSTATRPRVRAQVGKSLSDLAQAVRGPVVTARSGQYQRASHVYNERYDGARPLAIVEAIDDDDVRAAVKWAGARDVSVVPRSGGHSYAGYSTGDGVLVIDLSRMHSVRLDRAAGVATIEPGAQLIDVYAELAKHGATVPAGSCPSVGLGGLAPGGGMGLAGRRFGLTCDSVKSVDVVTADAELRKASSGSESDLYWASRGGGGGNFGVATRFQLTAHRVSSASWFNVSWPWSAASGALAAWQGLIPSAPDELTSIFHLSTGTSAPSVSANGQFFGSVDKLKKLLRPLTAVSGATLSTGSDSYMKLMLRWAGCLGQSLASCHTAGTHAGGTLERERFAAKSDYVSKALSSSGRAALVNAVERAQRTSALSSAAIIMDSYGGAINRVAPDATSFVHRDELFAIQYLTYFGSNAHAGPADAWLKAAWRSMRSHVSGMAYQDYIDPTLEGWQHAYYGRNYARLQQVKSTYDPDFRFRFRQAIRPTGT